MFSPSLLILHVWVIFFKGGGSRGSKCFSLFFFFQLTTLPFEPDLRFTQHKLLQEYTPEEIQGSRRCICVALVHELNERREHTDGSKASVRHRCEAPSVPPFTHRHRHRHRHRHTYTRNHSARAHMRTHTYTYARTHMRTHTCTPIGLLANSSAAPSLPPPSASLRNRHDTTCRCSPACHPLLGADRSPWGTAMSSCLFERLNLLLCHCALFSRCINPMRQCPTPFHRTVLSALHRVCVCVCVFLFFFCFLSSLSIISLAALSCP